MIPSIETFVDHVAAHAGISRDAAERVTRKALAGIGARLSPAVRSFVAEELPPDLQEALLVGDDVAVPLEEAVRVWHMPAAIAHELIASVGRVLGEALSDDALGLIAEISGELAQIVQRAAPAYAGGAAPARHETLATGRPGSHHPVSEARPSPQPGSVAAPDDARKLSSAGPTAQERYHETLAEGRPGSTRPLTGRH